MRIGIVTQWYSPERAPNPAPIARQLSLRGHEVKVLTGFPHYPVGKVFDGYRQCWSHQERQGDVDVRRVPLYASHDTSGIKRAATMLSFATTSSVAAMRYFLDCDAVYAYTSPATAASAAAVTRAVRGRPYVLHVQDLWPESVLESGMAGGRALRPLIAGSLDAALGYLYRRAAHVVAIAPTMMRTLVARGVPEDRASVVLNPADDERPAAFDPAVRARLGRPGRTLAVFAGNVGQMQDVETIVAAAALCRRDLPLDVAIVGSGTAAAAARRLAVELDADNVRFFDRVDSSEMPPVYAASDYQLVTLKDRPVFRQTIPSKLAGALAAGCPVITNVPGDVAEMCAEGGFGFSCAPEDPAALAQIFTMACAEDVQARQRKMRAALDYYGENMSMARAVDELESILARAAGAAAVRGRA